MHGSLLSRLAGAAVRIIFAVAILLPAQAQAQSIVGSWTLGGNSSWTFNANGRYTYSVSDPSLVSSCGGAGFVSFGGTYTASGGSVTIYEDTLVCNGSFNFTPVLFGSGTYTVTASTLVLNLQNAQLPTFPGFTLIKIGVTSVPPTTPLPPPTTVQSVYTQPSGQLAPAAVQVNSAGTFGSANLTVTLDIAQALLSSPTGFAAAGYNVYVVALVPGQVFGTTAPQFFVKPKAPGNWSALTFPIAAFLENVAQNSANNQVLIEILSNNDLSTLVGTEFYVGYGLSDQEMLAAKRYRGVFKTQ